jgi:putative ABC transport system permease protein
MLESVGGPEPSYLRQAITETVNQKQIMAIPFSYSFRNLWTRKWTSILTAGGMALVTFVFAAVLMLAQGLQQTLIDTGSPDNVIVLRGGAETEVSSAIDRASAALIEVQPEVTQDGRGEPIASKEALVLITVPKKETNKPTNVVVRGVGSQAMNLRPQVKLIAGRNFRPGSREVIAGKSIAETVKGGSLGETLSFALSQWNVVGVFDAGKTAFNSEVWGDADQLLSAFRRTTYSDVILKVPGQDAFEDLKNRLEKDPRLTVQVKREIAFYQQQSEVMAKFIRILGLATTLFFSIGAILGAMVTMYSAVANRTAEIGTLRALGFQRRSILVAFLAESLFLGLIGGTVGVAGGSLLQLITISTLNWSTFSELAFGFELTLSIVASTMAFAIVMGFVGGLLPAWRAARLKIVDALRES